MLKQKFKNSLLIGIVSSVLCFLSLGTPSYAETQDDILRTGVEQNFVCKVVSPETSQQIGEKFKESGNPTPKAFDHIVMCRKDGKVIVVLIDKDSISIGGILLPEQQLLDILGGTQHGA